MQKCMSWIRTLILPLLIAYQLLCVKFFSFVRSHAAGFCVLFEDSVRFSSYVHSKIIDINGTAGTVLISIRIYYGSGSGERYCIFSGRRCVCSAGGRTFLPENGEMTSWPPF